MPFTQRFAWAFGFLVLTASVIGIAGMLLGLDVQKLLFSAWFALPVFAVAWLVAPWVSTRVPFK